MTEYIDRKDLIKFLDNLRQPKMPITKGFEYISIDDAIRVVSERPTVQAIPLDKVKQARRELDKLPIYGAKFTDDFRIHLDREEVFSILDKLIAESEG